MASINAMTTTMMTAQVIIPSVRGSSPTTMKMTVTFLMTDLHTSATLHTTERNIKISIHS